MPNAPSKPVSFSRPKVGYFSNRPRIFVILKKYTMQKKLQLLCMILHSVTIQVSLWLYGIRINGQKHLLYNFMNIPHWIPSKPEKFPSPFPVPRRAPYSVSPSVISFQCKPHTHYIHMKYTIYGYEMIHITKWCVTFNPYAKNVTSTQE